MMDAKNRLAVTANIEAVLSFDGIPDKQWPKYLESKCGIPELNALRVLQSVAPIPPETLKALEQGLDVSEQWLLTGEPDSDRMRDLEIYTVLSGCPITDAEKLFRLRQDLLAEDPDAHRYFGLFRPGGVFPLNRVAQLYDDFRTQTRLKLMTPEQGTEATSPRNAIASPVQRPFTVQVDDNFHYMDPDERQTLGQFETLESAIAVCKSAVDHCLNKYYEAGMTAEELLSQYKSFGDDPFVVGPTDGVAFSAWDYAALRCQEITEHHNE